VGRGDSLRHVRVYALVPIRQNAGESCYGGRTKDTHATLCACVDEFIPLAIRVDALQQIEKLGFTRHYLGLEKVHKGFTRSEASFGAGLDARAAGG
jgi:hypothetical protein